MPSLNETIAWATSLHADQVDKAGAPYIGHVERVAGHLSRLFPDATADERHAAWLHDVIEDCSVQPQDLRDRGYSERVIETVLAVTKPPGSHQPYAERIAALAASGNRAAIRVKIADLTDNSDPERLSLLPAETRTRLDDRYTAALAVLRRALADLDPGAPPV